MEIRVKTATEFHDSHVTVEIVADGQTEVERLAEALPDLTSPGGGLSFDRRDVAQHLAANLAQRGLVLSRTERLYTAAEVGDAQASEAELVAAPLRRRIEELEAELARVEKGHVCVETCRPNAHVAFQGRARVRELETELAVAREEREEFARLTAAAWKRVNSLVEGQAADHREIVAIRSERDRWRAAMETTEAEASQARQRVIELTQELEEQRQRADENLAWAESAEARMERFTAEMRTTKDRELADARAAIQILSGQLGRISGAVHGPPIYRALRTTWERADARAMAQAIRQVRDALGSPTSPELASEPTSQA